MKLNKKITVNVKSILTGAGLLKAGLDNSGLVRNLDQQFGDSMLLKITEKIIRESAFEKTPEKQTRVKFNPRLSAIYISPSVYKPCLNPLRRCMRPGLISRSVRLNFVL